LAVNNLTFSDIGSLPQPHGVGEVWAASLWEMYWNLVTAYGFDEDLVGGSGGNNKTLELVVDGLKLQPCNPTFLEARDAILLAESTGSGASECLLWKAFAKRGMGSAATDSGNSASLVVSEDFSLPAQCAEYCGDGVVDGGENCDDGNLLALDGCSARCQNEVSVSFFGTATGGTVDLTLSGQALQLTTLPGQSAETVAANLAAAILADPVLSAQGVLAVAVGSDVVTDASVDLFVVNDTGLGTPVPALATGALVALMLLTAASGMRRLARPGAR
jgi:cysteine-rich repeat protein